MGEKKVKNEWTNTSQKFLTSRINLKKNTEGANEKQKLKKKKKMK